MIPSSSRQSCVRGSELAGWPEATTSAMEKRNQPQRKPSLIYVAGSMRQRDRILAVSKRLLAEGFCIFNEWINPGEECDEKWQEFEQAQGKTYLQALADPHARNVFEFDKRWLDKSDAFVLVYPAGRSAHTELGYIIGCGKPGLVLLDQEPDRWDVMLLFATGVFDNMDNLIKELKRVA